MNPLFLLAAAGALGAFFVFKKKPEDPPDVRERKMFDLAESIYRLSTGNPGPQVRALAVQLANYFNLPQTAKGIGAAGGALPMTEMWPGTQTPVAVYIKNYIELKKPKPIPKVGAPKPKYSDEAPISPFEDPRKIRAQAIAAEKSNPLQAKVLHAKADGLNSLIRAAKAKNAVVSNAKGVFSAVKSLTSVKA